MRKYGKEHINQPLYIQILLCLTIIFSASSTNAEPSSVIKYLMNKPVNVFEFGILRLNDRLEDQSMPGFYSFLKMKFDAVNSNVANSFAQYDDEKNRIQIMVCFQIDKKISDEDLRQLCKLASDSMKSNFRFRTIESYFQYGGFINKPIPFDLKKEIAGITEIIVEISYDANVIIRSQSPLLEDKIMYSK